MTWNDLLNTVLEELESWAEAFASMLPNLVVATLVLLAFWAFAKLATRGTSRIVRRLGASASATRLLSRIAGVAVFVSGLAIALGVLDLQRTVTSLLAGAGVVGLALGLAFQDIASNLLAGMSMSLRKPFNLGDEIKTSDFEGRVEDLDLRTTRLTTFDGQDVIIPNHDIYTNGLVNYTRSPRRRVDVAVGVGYDEDLQEVKEAAAAAGAGEIHNRDPDRDPEVLFTAFGGSSIDLVVRVWTTAGGKRAYLEAQSDLIQRIKESFDAAGIGIPYPIRTLDWSMAGGEPWGAMRETTNSDAREAWTQ